jgi:hypothetical protein
VRKAGDEKGTRVGGRLAHDNTSDSIRNGVDSCIGAPPSGLEHSTIIVTFSPMALVMPTLSNRTTPVSVFELPVTSPKRRALVACDTFRPRRYNRHLDGFVEGGGSPWASSTDTAMNGERKTGAETVDGTATEGGA